MSNGACPKCGVPIRPGKRFCSGCGAEIPEQLLQGGPVASKQGKSSVHLDADTVNILLQQFASRPEGPSFQFAGGKILMDQGDVKVSMANLKLSDARFQIQHAQMGAVQLDVGALQLSEGGLEIQLTVSINR
ncbi:MAG: zinc-ribbon domain-containing protein [Armatimonadetes bacterium]|nr:zinc-ribbon domain-containing protein [Armatimonadota bacterium]